jgi:hypothetical protein
MVDVHPFYLFVARRTDTYPIGILHDPREETVSLMLGEELGIVDLLS